MRPDGDCDAALLRGGVVVEDAAVVVGVSLGVHVDAQEGDFGVLAVARALWLPVVPRVDDADEVVERLHLDGHDAGAAGRLHDGAEHGGSGGRAAPPAAGAGGALVSGVGAADGRGGCRRLWCHSQRTGVGDRRGVKLHVGGALRIGKLKGKIKSNMKFD